MNICSSRIQIYTYLIKVNNLCQDSGNPVNMQKKRAVTKYAISVILTNFLWV